MLRPGIELLLDCRDRLGGLKGGKGGITNPPGVEGSKSGDSRIFAIRVPDGEDGGSTSTD